MLTWLTKLHPGTYLVWSSFQVITSIKPFHLYSLKEPFSCVHALHCIPRNLVHIKCVILPIQRIQTLNSLARIVLESDSLTHSEPLLWQLHWLPVHSRIRFKFATITYKAMYINSPQYLSSYIHYHQPVHSLRSSDLHFFVPTPSSTNFGSRYFRSAAPVIWNLIPLEICYLQT